MESVTNQERNVVLTFLRDTKDGKYAEVDTNMIEVPRIITSRDEYLFGDEIPVYFSITNQL